MLKSQQVSGIKRPPILLSLPFDKFLGRYLVPKASRNKLRNLVQYRDKTDEEFDEIFENYSMQEEDNQDIELRIEEVMNNFSLNYDLRDMNANDTLSLRELAKTFVLLDNLGKIEQRLLEDGAIAQLRAVSSIKKEYLENASKLQSDLNIKRQQRQNETGENLADYLPSIQKRAKVFYSQRLAYIYCPECKMLCGNAWFTDWQIYNELMFTCPREDCGNKFKVSSQYLAEHGNKNVEGVLPV
jgi:hypothetical protein